ncbi:tRNA pseudouridine(38-40) synthase TruA [Alkalihalobacillus sp. LMS39]|uniref:tRNA pseudouridine(38-40) synthase TruA n=1 Tax=Alkalihalobacillus sp. LMS39 TaxID=2924032 RepID=UPI001FB1AE1C|nr:tRNA pseudouridine(38-40) synthase TruA [Alkalihalobacillus sp. LMS39]UOE94283.1 tRNA pseudouridine(38-40) synthase TruA [Alkalihalobacillus sp. LMS39]
MVKRIKCIVSYDGSEFSGFQIQPNKRTVQGELEAALRKVHKGQDVSIFGSGRTDAGVHAQGQVIHFDTPLLAIHEERWPRALRSLLPDDICILEAEEVTQSFHARFDVKTKEYRYRLSCTQRENVFRRKYVFHYPYPLQLDKMKVAANALVGTFDFTSFCSAKTVVGDKVRTIYELDLIEEGHELVIRVVGNGFLYNMVRIIVGTLLEVGQGKKEPTDILKIIEAKSRHKAGKTAPSHGLYLWKVTY